jgi:hypothetical protein
LSPNFYGSFQIMKKLFSLAQVAAPAILCAIATPVPASAQAGGANAWNNYVENVDPGYDKYHQRSGRYYNPDYALPVFPLLRLFWSDPDPNKPRRYKHPEDTRFPCRDGNGNVYKYATIAGDCREAAAPQNYGGNQNLQNQPTAGSADQVAHTESNTVVRNGRYCVVTMMWDKNSNYVGSKEIC